MDIISTVAANKQKYTEILQNAIYAINTDS